MTRTSLTSTRVWRVAALVVVALSLTGCAHELVISSDRPGAAVHIDGVRRGVTPLVVEEHSGTTDVARVEVTDEQTGESLRFDVVHGGWQPAAVALAIVAGVGTLVLAGLHVVPFMIGYVSLYAFIAFAAVSGVPLDPVLALTPVFAIFAVMIGSYAGGLVLAASAPTVVLFALGEGARTAPDEVYVDFAARSVSSSPAELVVPLIGSAHGRAVGAAKRDEGATPADTGAPPALAPVDDIMRDVE